MNTVFDGALRTTDLALSAVLTSLGFEHRLERLSSTRAQWVFACEGDKQAELEAAVARYEQFALRVEPRSFLEDVGRLRKQLYDLVPPPHQRRRSAPSSDGATAS